MIHLGHPAPLPDHLIERLTNELAGQRAEVVGVLFEADDFPVTQIDGLSQRDPGQTRHAQNVTGQNDEEARAGIDLNRANRDLETLRPAAKLRIIREGARNLRNADGKA